jgi:hypothetical protein
VVVAEVPSNRLQNLDTRPRYGKTLVDHEFSLVCPACWPTQSEPGRLPKRPWAGGPWTSVDSFSQTSPGRGQDWPGQAVRASERWEREGKRARQTGECSYLTSIAFARP